MTSTFERFMARVDDSGDCWLWLGAKSSNGYGAVSVGGRMKSAHRYSYEQHVGSIPAGLQIDHLCRVRNCVNPAHLEAVTGRTNVLRSPDAPSAINARKTHCIHGHEYTPENTLLQKRGKYCRECHRQKLARRRLARKAVA